MPAATASGAGPPGAGPGVARRHVLFISGFDPKGARHYHSVFQREAGRWSAGRGERLSVGRRRREPAAPAFATTWPVVATAAPGAVATTFEQLGYDDIVRAHWGRGPLGVAAGACRWALGALASGYWRRVHRTSWPIGLTIAMAPLQVLGGVLLGLLTAGLAGFLLAPLLAGHGLAAGLLAAPAGLAAGLLGWRLAEGRTNSLWISRIVVFTEAQAQGRTADMEARLEAFAARLAEAVAEPGADEILLVGHSIGSHLMVSTLARALARDPVAVGRAAGSGRLALLTLGQTLPLLGLHREAAGFRAELERVAALPGLAWVDFSSPPDPACFPLCEPRAAIARQIGPAGVAAPGGAADRPKLLNPRFARLFEPERYRRLKRDWHAIHFQYLMAADRPGDYDFLAITTGPLRLAERYAASPGVTDFDRFRRP